MRQQHGTDETCIALAPGQTRLLVDGCPCALHADQHQASVGDVLHSQMRAKAVWTIKPWGLQGLFGGTPRAVRKTASNRWCRFRGAIVMSW